MESGFKVLIISSFHIINIFFIIIKNQTGVAEPVAACQRDFLQHNFNSFNRIAFQILTTPFQQFSLKKNTIRVDQIFLNFYTMYKVKFF